MLFSAVNDRRKGDLYGYFVSFAAPGVSEQYGKYIHTVSGRGLALFHHLFDHAAGAGLLDVR